MPLSRITLMISPEYAVPATAQVHGDDGDHSPSSGNGAVGCRTKTIDATIAPDPRAAAVRDP